MTVSKNDPAVRAFRDTLGMFPTGVTVITARGPGGEPIGLTVSSFNSVSLTPPLVVWSLSSHLQLVPALENAPVYAINVLAEDQQELSNRFAWGGGDKWADLDYATGEHGAPVFDSALATFECMPFAQYPGGDHIIFVAEVRQMRFQDGEPLVFCAGGYRQLTEKETRA